MWLANSYSGAKHAKIQAVAGRMAGNLGKRGYWSVGYNGKLHKAHRIIWELHHGAIPGQMVMDHIDGNSTNNIISNLRLVSLKVNARNKSKASTNTSGVTGVSFHKNGFWAAHHKDEDGRHRTKYFSVAKLGNEEAFRAACAARESAIKSLEGYTDRHGKLERIYVPSV